jgi:hypothetical protein
MIKNLNILFVILVGSLGCKITQSQSDSFLKGNQCEIFYIYSQDYKSKFKKNEIISQWKKNGYSVSDTTIYKGNWNSPLTKILGRCDTIEYVNFQIWDKENYTKIYFHGICLKNEKKKNKTQKELKNLKKEIEDEYLKYILLN